MLVEELLGDMRELRRDTRVRIVHQRGTLVRPVDGHHQMALAETEVEELVDILLRLHQHILADNADVRRTILDIRRHIRRLRDDEADFLFLVRDDELAGLVRKPFRRIADFLEELRRQPEELPLRQRHRQIFRIACLHNILPLSW